MSLVRCPNGHVFSARRHGNICPYCNMETVKAKNENNEAGEESAVALELFTEEAEPVCGWFVCIDGARVGRDFKIKNGKNFIGRGDDMDIQILGDNGISRRNHAIVVYDTKKRNTVMLPGDGAGIAYLNGEAVYLPTQINAYDVLEMGQSKFLFVPFCGEHFEWNDAGL